MKKILTGAVMYLVKKTIKEICEEGGWELISLSAQPGRNHAFISVSHRFRLFIFSCAHT